LSAVRLLILFFLLVPLTSFHTGNSQRTAYIQEFPVHRKDAGPLDVAVDQTGRVWFTESNASRIGLFDPLTGKFTDYATPTKNSGPELIAVDRNGNIWFTERLVDKIGRFDPKTETFTEYDVPTERSNPTGILADPLGRIWFTEFTGNKIGLIEPGSTRIREFEVPTNRSGPLGLFYDSEGFLWFTQAYAGKVGRLDPTTGEINEYAPDVRISSPVGIVVQKGVVWLADHGSNDLVKFFPGNRSAIKYPTSPATAYPISLPNGLAADGDGDIWVAEHAGNKIAKFIVSQSAFVEYPIPTGPFAITLWLKIDAQGNVWFAEWLGNRIGRLTPPKAMPFTADLDAKAVEVQIGQSQSVGLRLLDGLGSARSIQLNYTNRPYGVSIKFDRNPLTLEAGGSSVATVRISAEGTASPGTYRLSISADDGSIIYSIPFTLTISKPALTAGLDKVLVPALTVGAIVLLGLAFIVRRRRMSRKVDLPPSS